MEIQLEMINVNEDQYNDYLSAAEEAFNGLYDGDKYKDDAINQFTLSDNLFWNKSGTIKAFNDTKKEGFDHEVIFFLTVLILDLYYNNAHWLLKNTANYKVWNYNFTLKMERIYFATASWHADELTIDIYNSLSDAAKLYLECI